jgi:capsular polysaccharide biosynthesis protein
MLNILLSIFVGTLLGVGAALALELLHRRIRSPEDLSLALDLPVLAVFEPEARTGSWLDRLGKLLPNRRLKTA